MEIDHFDPREKKKNIHSYKNLFLATRHCNGAKDETWPTKKEMRDGIRFLNCCEEQDYGVHIFENPDSHELIGASPAGIFQIEICDLNAPHLVKERQRRAELIRLLEGKNLLFQLRCNRLTPDFIALIKLLREQVDNLIPEIPALLS